MKLLFIALAALLLVASTAVTTAAVVPVDSNDEVVVGSIQPLEDENLVEPAATRDDGDASYAVKEDAVKDFDSYVSDEQVDMKQLVDDLVNLHESAYDVIERVESTLSTLQAFIPHSIRRRQATTIEGSIERGSGGGAHGRIDVNHRRGNTVFNGNVSHGRGSGTRWGAGVSHSSSRHGNWGVNISRDRSGTSGSASYGRTWNNGRTSLSGNVNRGSGGGTSGGITFTHRF